MLTVFAMLFSWLVVMLEVVAVVRIAGRKGKWAYLMRWVICVGCFVSTILFAAAQSWIVAATWLFNCLAWGVIVYLYWYKEKRVRS